MRRRKGVSPVVAVVLLIAVTVTVSVGVWYWVAGLSANPNVDEPDTMMTVGVCDVNPGETSRIQVRNTGSKPLTGLADLYGPNDNKIGYVNLSSASEGSLDPGESELVDIENTTLEKKVNYKVIGEQLPTVEFMCN